MNRLELLTNEIFSKDAILPQSESIFRLDIGMGERAYFKAKEDGSITCSDSVTTIIKRYHAPEIGITMWNRKMGDKAESFLFEAAEYGRFMHIVFNTLIRGKSISFSNDGLFLFIKDYIDSQNISIWQIDVPTWIRKIRQDIIGFLTWYRDYKVKPIALEYVFVNEDFSGAIDFVCSIEDVSGRYDAIVDFKSGRKGFYSEYAVQLSGYKDGWNLEQKRKIGRIFNYGAKDYRLPVGKGVTPYNFTEQTDSVECLRWNEYITMNKRERRPVEKYYDYNQDISVSISNTIKDVVVEIDPIQQVINRYKDAKEIDDEINTHIEKVSKLSKGAAKHGKSKKADRKNSQRVKTRKAPASRKNKSRRKK
jgi:hypothetical protein